MMPQDKTIHDRDQVVTVAHGVFIPVKSRYTKLCECVREGSTGGHSVHSLKTPGTKSTHDGTHLSSHDSPHPRLQQAFRGSPVSPRMGRAAGNQAGTSDFLLRRVLRTALLAACLAAALGDGALLGLIAPDQRPHRPGYRLPGHLAPPATAWASARLPQAPAHVRAGRGAVPRGPLPGPLRGPPPGRDGASAPGGPGGPLLLRAARRAEDAGADTAADRTLSPACARPSSPALWLSFSPPTPRSRRPWAACPPPRAASRRCPPAVPTWPRWGSSTARGPPWTRGPGAPARPAERHKLVAVLCLVVTPVLNPLIDSLRNREVHPAARSALAGLRGSGTARG
uniref:Uncharacterized protein n=1 Tax=Rangifer tarandus platyrhynchus TaxID=3082113 RepID=A0ACB0EB68_RANTA|nr:unnamed protein product [Rangifer tarandus platyrhynchus]